MAAAAAAAAYVQAKGWDETSLIPLIKPSVILFETVFLVFPLHVHCPNPCFRARE